MKTPKVATPKPKLKFNTPKSGLVRKSLGNNSAASLKKLTNKGKEQVLSMVKDNEDNVEFKGKTPKKARMSLPANALRNSKSSPENGSGAKTPKKSPKNKKGAVSEQTDSGKKNTPTKETPAKNSPATKPQNVKKTPQIKNVQQNVSTPASVENNTSPIKQNIESKKTKVPFNLDDSLANGTPEKPKQKKGAIQGKTGPKSPEVELGLQLEEALSPKSKKEKKKKMALGAKVAAEGKVAVNKKAIKKLDVTSTNSSPDPKKKKRRRNRKGSKKSGEKKERKPSFLTHVNATNAVNALLKISKPQKGNLLDGDEYIFLQFGLLKQSKDPRGVYKVILPHCILPDTPEVCLVVPDLKGKRNEPEEAIEHYTELLKSKGITSITEIIPLRKLKQDYSQYEERRKLTNRFDCIISDGRITHVAQLGKRFARAKKCICPIKFASKSLKEDIEKSLRKVAIFSAGQGSSFSVKVGRRGMSAGDIADNIVAIGEFLANNETMIGEPLNVSIAAVKTARSTSFPVYTSTLTPNDVKSPKGKKQKVEEPVEDEVTTVPDGTVVVYPSGNVKVKKRKNEEDKDDVKQKNNKKAKTNASKKAKVEEADDDGEEESDSDVDLDSLGDEDSAVDSLNGTDDEASDDESEIEDDDDDEEGDEDDDDDDSIDEEELQAAENAYLEELKMQLEMSKKKVGKKSGRIANIIEKKEEQAKQQNKNAGAKGAKQQAKKGLQNEQQKQTKKDVLKEQDTNAKGKKVDKQNQVKKIQNNVPKKKPAASPKNQQQQKGNQNQKKNKLDSPQKQQKGKVEQFGKGKGPNKRNAQQKGGSPAQGKKQFKKGPGAKNKK